MKKGFTLIELMVALSIFIVVMTISMGSIISVFDANRKSRSLKAVLSNLNLAVESMSREIRFGTNYHCDYLVDTITDPRNCSYPDDGSGSISFLSSDGDQITYRVEYLGGPSAERRIEKRIGPAGGDNWIAVTAPEVIIDNLILTFYVLGAEAGDDLQPKVIIMIKGHAGAEGKGGSDFALQTTVSQRALDI